MADHLSRRALFAAAAASLVGVAAGRVPGVSAATTDMMAGAPNDADAVTTLHRTTDGPTLGVSGSDPTGSGVLRATNSAGSAIVGYSGVATTEAAISGWAGSSNGIGVKGDIEGTAFQGDGVGVMGRSLAGKGVGVSGSSINIGVDGSGDAIGVRGLSDAGRGGVFGGPRAQLRLVPSSAATHPASGSKGDLFMDRSSRLWLCRGGSIWVRVA